jgi:hypothetical protein
LLPKALYYSQKILLDRVIVTTKIRAGKVIGLGIRYSMAATLGTHLYCRERGVPASPFELVYRHVKKMEDVEWRPSDRSRKGFSRSHGKLRLLGQGISRLDAIRQIGDFE